MNDLLIHPKTNEQLSAFIAQPSHAVLISGPAGSGKLSLAINLAETALCLKPGQLNKYGYIKTLKPIEGKAIGIEEIRELERFLSLIVPIDKPYNRLVIIQDSHKLTIEAQNAMLSILEEPPKSTMLILTTNSSQSLLPTIRSRTQIIHLVRPDETQTKDFFINQNHDDKKIKQAYSISGGLPGLMSSILSDEEHPLTVATEQARKLLSQTTYERLLCVDELSKQRDLSINIVFILKQMAHLSLQAATGKVAVKWRRVLKASYEASEGLYGNANAKLTLTKLMLNL